MYKIQAAQKKLRFIAKIGLTDCVLPKQIHNKIRKLKGFDSGTKCKLSPECGLARANPQWPGVLDLFRKPKISWFNFWADLKAQSKHCDKTPGSFLVAKFLSVIFVEYELQNG